MTGDDDPTSLSSEFNNPNDLTNPSTNPIWDHHHHHNHPTNSQNLGGFCDINMQNNNTTSSTSLGFFKHNLFIPPKNLEMCWAPTMLPHNLSQFPTDLGFIDWEVRLSSFSANNFEYVMNPFSNVRESCLSAYACRPQVEPQEGFVGNGFKSASGEESKEMHRPVDCGTHDGCQPKQGGSCFSGNNLFGETEFSGGGDENSNEEGSKKRRSDQDSEHNLVKQSPKTPSEVTMNNNEGQPKVEDNPICVSNKSTGKQGKQLSVSPDAPKEEYIHVRARRGQATNSHSVAERVRREKISERMKFLQDLVPGCSKVTGKAVMLDEIINYVQSLQRQIEFLSMKLAIVNPRMDFNLEGLMAKDTLESRLGSLGSLCFGADVAMPYTPMDAVRRTVNSQLMSVSNGFKDPASHVSNPWDDELHNIVQIRLNPNTSISSQNLGSTLHGQLKTEP